MVIDRVLLPSLRSLFHPPQLSISPFFQFAFVSPPCTASRKKGRKLTGASIQALNDCSNCWHPAAAFPDDAQHPVNRKSAPSLISLGKKADIPSTEVMIPTQGFSPGLFGRRTRSLGRGGRRGGASFVLPPFGGMIVVSTGEEEILSLIHWTASSTLQILARSRTFVEVGESAKSTPSR